MKKLFTNITILGVSGLMVFMSACDKTDPLPISKASFVIVSTAPEVDVPVKFENQSLNAASFVWDYGDGESDSLVVAPEHTYASPGDYSVKMTAYTEDGQKSESVQDITVGERFLTGMFIMNINMKDDNGDPWDDDGSGPDVLFQLGPQDATSLDDLAFVFIDSLNVGQFKTPIGITTQDLLQPDYKLTNKDFFILLEEVDTVNNQPEYTTMANIPFNPVVQSDEFITVTKRTDGTGDIAIPFAVLQEYQFFPGI